MRIESIAAVPLSHDLDFAYGMARGLSSSRQTTLVVLRADNGLLGVGEAWGPSSAIKTLIDQFRGQFVGLPLAEVRPRIRLLWAGHYHMGYQGFQFGVWGAIDTASWDIRTKALGVPLHEVIGGSARKAVMAYGSSGYATETNDDGFFREQIQGVKDSGFKAVKIKIGMGPRSDERRVKTTREIMGDDALLLVDVNGAYTADVAIASIDRIRPYDIHWIEEPVSPEDKRGYQRLRNIATPPIAAGEASFSTLALRDYIQDRLVDVVQPDVNKIGGISEMCTARDLAELNGIRYSPHCWAGAVALSATLQILATVTPYPGARDDESPVLLEFDQGRNPLRDDILERPHTIDAAGFVEIPQQPGLGIDIDWDAVRHLTSDPTALEIIR